MRYFIIFLLSILPVSMAHADRIAIPVWTMQKENSHIKFEAKQMGAEVEGKFEKFESEIYFDPHILSTGNVKVTVDVASVNTDYDKRDATMTGKEWFDIENHPTVTFTCNNFQRVSGSAEKGEYSCDGKLKILDVTKDITLPFHLEITEANGKRIADMTSKLTLNRQDFKLGRGDWADSSIIGNDVILDIAVKATTP